MYRSQSALVVVDFRQDVHHALPRGIELAKKFGTNLTFVTCAYQPVIDIVPKDSSIDTAQLKHEAIAHYEDKLRTLVEPYLSESDNFEVSFEIIWSKSFKKGLG